MFIEGRTFSMSETAIQQIEYFDDCQDKLFRISQAATLIIPGTPNDEETRKIVPPPEDEGNYQYDRFPLDLNDVIDQSDAKMTRVDSFMEKHPGLRTPTELRQANALVQEYFLNDYNWPKLLKEQILYSCII